MQNQQHKKKIHNDVNGFTVKVTTVEECQSRFRCRVNAIRRYHIVFLKINAVQIPVGKHNNGKHVIFWKYIKRDFALKIPKHHVQRPRIDLVLRHGRGIENEGAVRIIVVGIDVKGARFIKSVQIHQILEVGTVDHHRFGRPGCRTDVVHVDQSPPRIRPAIPLGSEQRDVGKVEIDGLDRIRRFKNVRVSHEGHLVRAVVLQGIVQIRRRNLRIDAFFVVELEMGKGDIVYAVVDHIAGAVTSKRSGRPLDHRPVHNAIVGIIHVVCRLHGHAPLEKGRGLIVKKSMGHRENALIAGARGFADGFRQGTLFVAQDVMISRNVIQIVHALAGQKVQKQRLRPRQGHLRAPAVPLHFGRQCLGQNVVQRRLLRTGVPLQNTAHVRRIAQIAIALQKWALANAMQ